MFIAGWNQHLRRRAQNKESVFSGKGLNYPPLLFLLVNTFPGHFLIPLSKA